jgi:hypothetical protein
MTYTILPVVGYEGHYSVSSTGEVFTHKGGKTRLMKPDTDTVGYQRVRLCLGGIIKAERVHRIVCKAFHPDHDPALNIVNHLNGIKTSNEAVNLEWTSDFGNRQHAMANGLSGAAVAVRGSKHPSSKLNEEKVREIRAKKRAGTESYTSLAAEYGVARPTIIHVCLNRTWTHVQ